MSFFISIGKKQEMATAWMEDYHSSGRFLVNRCRCVFIWQNLLVGLFVVGCQSMAFKKGNACNELIINFCSQGTGLHLLDEIKEQNFMYIATLLK